MASPSLPLGPDPGTTAAVDAWRHRAASRVFVAFVFACLLSIAAFPDVWASMVRVWSNSETFAHGFIALPCAAWMLWRRRDDWSALAQRVWWPGVIALIGCGLLWLAGRLGGVSSIEQFGVVGIIPSTVLLLVGPAVTRALAFPLAFLFFAVPVGEFLTPIMMDYTADATVTALRWTGIPVFREGLHFSLPTGRWSVVEACSGLRYLIASLALGVLYAYLQFRTLKYRLAIVALAIAVPIVANWIRAYLIVLLGHVSDMRLAAGADHLIYGWLFFGIVMALLFWIGSLWHEPAQRPAPSVDVALHAAPVAVARQAEAPPRALASRAVLAGMAIAIVASLLWRPLSAGLLDATQPVDAVAALQKAIAPFPETVAIDFAPHYDDATGALRSARSVAGAPVEVHAFYYARQHETQEMIHAAHAVVRASDFAFPVVSSGTQRMPWGTVAAYRLGSAGASGLLVWHWYAVGDTQTASAYRAKAATAWSLATGRGDHSLAIVLATPLRSEEGRTRAESMQAAARRLGEMANALQPAIDSIAHGRSADAKSLVRAGSTGSPGTSASLAAPAPSIALPGREPGTR